MIVSAAWLSDYVGLPDDTDLLAERLAMAGLNHESTNRVGDDAAIELEVTSNRSDCLGHIGVAREVAVLFDRPLHLPDPQPPEGPGDASQCVSVEIREPRMCPFYTARVIRGVRVGPSPEWLVGRLATVGVASVNTIVDVTNYVMLECGQPLHAFDLARLRGGRIVVRAAAEGESFAAINHRNYTLAADHCVIADAEGPVALAGVMGGAESEIGPETVDVLIESGQFDPLAVRTAARGLGLASDSSFRFERRPDPAMVECASRRAAALILELAGGTLQRGRVEAGRLEERTALIPLAAGRVEQVLGMPVPADRQRSTLSALGFVEQSTTADGTLWLPPSWRRDVTREIDLVEEIARIVGYDRIPENVTIAARAVAESPRQRVGRIAGEVMVAAGCYEAMTRSVVDERLDAVGSPWSDSPSLVISPPLVRGADRLRRSLLPSLLEAAGLNAAVAAGRADLFELARAYLPCGDISGLPEEPLLLSAVVAGDYALAKGLLEAVLSAEGLDPTAATGPSRLICRRLDHGLFTPGRGAEVLLERAGHGPLRLALLGEVSAAMREMFGLTGQVSAFEARLDPLEAAIRDMPRIVRPSDYPPVERDLNLVVDESVPWATLAESIGSAVGDLLERLRLVEVWRDDERIGPGRKSLVVSLTLRSHAGTLSGDEAAAVVERIVEACSKACGATLR